MGGGPTKDKKFINKLMKKISSGDKELFIVDDRNGTPTYTHDFAKNVKLLIENNYSGLFNMVCGGQTSRFEVAKELVKVLRIDKEIKLKKVTSRYFEKEYFAPRPASERLINYKLDLIKMNIMRDWRLCLKEYIENYYIEI